MYITVPKFWVATDGKLKVIVGVLVVIGSIVAVKRIIWGPPKFQLYVPVALVISTFCIIFLFAITKLELRDR